MAQAQVGKSVDRSAASKKAAATRAANKAAATTGAVEGPKGRKLADAPADVAPITEEQRQGERRQQQANNVAQFTPQEHTTPAVHAPELSEEAAKQQAFEAAVKAMAESMGVPVPPALNAAPAAAPRADKQQKNGITRPASGSVTGTVWDVADEISRNKNGDPAAIAELKADARLKQTNDHTLKTQYSRWRQYHGVKGQVTAAPKAVMGQEVPEVQAPDYQGPDRREHAPE